MERVGSGIGEECDGYYDADLGRWHESFQCPMYQGADALSTWMYCCGTSKFRYCCPFKENEVVALDINLSVGAYFAIAFACLVLLLSIVVLCCFFCPYCWLYKMKHPDRDMRMEVLGRAHNALLSPLGLEGPTIYPMTTMRISQSEPAGIPPNISPETEKEERRNSYPPRGTYPFPALTEEVPYPPPEEVPYPPPTANSQHQPQMGSNLTM